MARKTSPLVTAAVDLADMFGEDAIEKAAALLVSATTAVSKVEIVQRAVVSLTSHLSPREIKWGAQAFKLLSQGMQLAVKRKLREKLTVRGVDIHVADTVIDTVDDTFGAIIRHADASLTPESVNAYIAAAAQTAGTRHNLNTPIPATPPAAGVPVTPTTATTAAGVPTPAAASPPPAPIVSVASTFAIPTPRCMRLLNEAGMHTEQAIRSDRPGEVFKPREKKEARREAIRKDPVGVLVYLESHIAQGVLSNEEIIFAFDEWIAPTYLTDGKVSQGSRLGDTGDELLDGGLRQSLKNFLTAVLQFGKRYGIPAAKYLFWTIVIMIALGIGCFAQAILLIADDAVNPGTLWGVIGVGILTIPFWVIATIKTMIVKAADKADDPIQWVGEFLKTLARGDYEKAINIVTGGAAASEE